MALPAVATAVDSHQIELFSRKENRMYPGSPGEMFSAEGAVGSPLFRWAVCPAGVPRSAGFPVLPAPEQYPQSGENENENYGVKDFCAQRQESELQEEQIPVNSRLWPDILCPVFSESSTIS